MLRKSATCKAMLCITAVPVLFLTVFLMFRSDSKPTRTSAMREMVLDMSDLRLFVDKYFPSAAKEWNAEEMTSHVQSLEGLTTVVVRSEHGECIIECKLVLLRPGLNGRYSVRFNGDSIDGDNGVRVASSLCNVWGLPKSRLTEWDRGRDDTVAHRPSFLQVGKYRDHRVAVEIFANPSDIALLRVLFEVEI